MLRAEADARWYGPVDYLPVLVEGRDLAWVLLLTFGLAIAVILVGALLAVERGRVARVEVHGERGQEVRSAVVAGGDGLEARGGEKVASLAAENERTARDVAAVLSTSTGASPSSMPPPGRSCQ